MALNVGRSLDALSRVGDDARPIGVGLAVRRAERRDGLGLRHLMRQHIAQGPNSPISSLPLRIASISAL